MTGGGNFWRGRTSETIDRTKADQIGMLATVMNCIYVSDIFRHVGMQTEVFTPFVCGAFTTLFSKDKAVDGAGSREESSSLREEQAIPISPRIQGLCCGPSRSRPTPCCLPRR